jgi:hypothetical protein
VSAFATSKTNAGAAQAATVHIKCVARSAKDFAQSPGVKKLQALLAQHQHDGWKLTAAGQQVMRGIPPGSQLHHRAAGTGLLDIPPSAVTPAATTTSVSNRSLQTARRTVHTSVVGGADGCAQSQNAVWTYSISDMPSDFWAYATVEFCGDYGCSTDSAGGAYCPDTACGDFYTYGNPGDGNYAAALNVWTDPYDGGSFELTGKYCTYP